MKLNMKPFIVVVVALVAMAPLAHAQSSSDGWQFAIAPYVWLAGPSGSLSIGDDTADPPEVEIDRIIDTLEFAFMGHFEMRNERWMFSSELVVVNLAGSRDSDLVTVSTGLDTTLFELAGGYRVSPALTLFAGARLVDMDTYIGLDGLIEERRAEADKSWVDPLVGVHLLAPLSDKWWIGVRGDVGGFGVGSELTWQVYADVGFRISKLVSVLAGYRALNIDYESGNDLETVALDVMISKRWPLT
jgi:hypothetical protein